MEVLKKVKESGKSVYKDLVKSGEKFKQAYFEMLQRMFRFRFRYVYWNKVKQGTWYRGLISGTIGNKYRINNMNCGL